MFLEVIYTYFQGVAFTLSTLYRISTCTFALISGHFKAGEHVSDQDLQVCFQEILRAKLMHV